MSNFIPNKSYLEMPASGIKGYDPERKTVPAPPVQPGQPAPQVQEYHNITLAYNFGTPESPFFADFKFEGPELYSPSGINPRVENGGRTTYSIGVMLPETDANAKAFAQMYEQYYHAVAQHLGTVKGKVGIYNFNAQSPEMGFKNPLYYPRDKVTGDIIQGRDISTYFKLFRRGGIIKEQSLFTGLDSKEIAWDTLIGVEMKFIPIIHWERVYVGSGKFSLQVKLISAVVTWVRKRNSETTQSDTIVKYSTNNPNAASILDETIKKLMMEKEKNSLSAQVTTLAIQGNNGGSALVPFNQASQPTFGGPNQTNGGSAFVPFNQASQPTFGGLNQTNGGAPQQGQIPSIPQLHNVPMFQPQPQQGSSPQPRPNMAQYTSGAPTSYVPPGANPQNQQYGNLQQ